MQINGKKVDKYWGYELWIHNSELYCGKLLVFNKNSKFSMHYHMLKEETWYVSKGKFEYRWIDTNTAIERNKIVSEGDIIHIERGKPHQLESLEEIGEIFEVSTQHFDEDSYRIRLGN